MIKESVFWRKLSNSTGLGKRDVFFIFGRWYFYCCIMDSLLLCLHLVAEIRKRDRLCIFIKNNTIVFVLLDLRSHCQRQNNQMTDSRPLRWVKFLKWILRLSTLPLRFSIYERFVNWDMSIENLLDDLVNW